MTKQEAATFLNVSVRAIERYTAKGRLSVHYSRGKRGNIANYDDTELRALKDEMNYALTIRKPAIARETPTPATSTVKADSPDRQLAPTVSDVSAFLATATPALTQAIQAGLFDLANNLNGKIERLAAAIEAGKSNGVTPLADLAHKLTLSITEAARLSGLSESAIKTAIKKGKLKTIAKKELRIKRASLEKFISKL